MQLYDTEIGNLSKNHQVLSQDLWFSAFS